MSDVKVSVGTVSQKAVAKGKSGAEIIEVSTEVIFEDSTGSSSSPQYVCTYFLAAPNGKVLPRQFSEDQALQALLMEEKELSEDAEDLDLIVRGEWPTKHLFGLKGRSTYDKDQDAKKEEKLVAVEVVKGSVARLLSGSVTISQVNDDGPSTWHFDLIAYAAQDNARRWARVPQSDIGAREFLESLHVGKSVAPPRGRSRSHTPR